MNNKTYYHLILDQSGSMQDCIAQTVAGFNEQLQVLDALQRRHPGQEILVGLTRFNHEIMHTYFAKKPFEIKKLDTAVYNPGGTTALYDAIGGSVSKIRESINGELETGLATVVVVILTDGHENASTTFTFSAIKKLIKKMEKTGKWTFSYIGATIDAVEIAQTLHIQTSNSMVYDKTDTGKMYSKISRSLDNYLELKNEGIVSNDFLLNE